jgi:hypothetical protein
MFRFTIRELLLITLVVALGVGWGVDRWSTASDRDAWRSRAIYWSGAADTVQRRLVESGHRVEFIEGVGVEIDNALILITSQPENQSP